MRPHHPTVIEASHNPEGPRTRGLPWPRRCPGKREGAHGLLFRLRMKGRDDGKKAEVNGNSEGHEADARCADVS